MVFQTRPAASRLDFYAQQHDCRRGAVEMTNIQLGFAAEVDELIVCLGLL